MTSFVSVAPTHDATGKLRVEANHLIIGTMFFPECMRSIEQYAAIEVLEDNAPASEAQGQLFSLVRKDMEVRKIQGYATARLAGGLLTLKEAGLPVTFNRAV